MTGWNVAPGQWSLAEGLDANGDDVIDGTAQTRSVAFERSLGTKVTLAPRQTSIIDMKLVTPGDDPAKRADLGVGSFAQAIRGGARIEVADEVEGALGRLLLFFHRRATRLSH